MKKYLLAGALAAVALTGSASAQDRRDMRHDRQEMRHDRQDMRHDRRELRQDRRDWRSERRDVRQDRRWGNERRRVTYVAPYRDWTYRPLGVGYQLRPGFWNQQYVIGNYGSYGLARPGWNQRWIRYGNDLLLVNVRTGRILRVFHNRYY